MWEISRMGATWWRVSADSHVYGFWVVGVVRVRIAMESYLSIVRIVSLSIICTMSGICNERPAFQPDLLVEGTNA